MKILSKPVKTVCFTTLQGCYVQQKTAISPSSFCQETHSSAFLWQCQVRNSASTSSTGQQGQQRWTSVGPVPNCASVLYSGPGLSRLMPFSSSSTVHLQILSRSTSSRGFTRHQHEIVGSFREGFPSNSNKKDGLLHDSATTLRVHLVHIHREFFLSISYDLTQGHRQNAKTHLFQRQNSSRIHSEESLFGKKKRSGINKSNHLDHFNQTQIFNPFLSFPFNHFTNLHKNKIKQQTFRPTPSKTLHISSISTISTTNWSKASIWLRSWSLSRSYLANNSSRSFVFCRAEARRTACSLAPGTDEDDSTGWGAFGRW